MRRTTDVEVLPPLSVETLAGYKPERLDDIVQPLLEAAQTAMMAIRQVLPLLQASARGLDPVRIQALMATPEGINQAERLATYAERTTKVVKNLSDVVDKLSRLRSMLSGGPDRRVEFGSMSDRDLATLIYQFVGECPKCGHKFTA